jgi:hypothetical protein
MKKQHSKTPEYSVPQLAECLREYRSAFKELALRSGKSKSFVSKWSKGIRNSDLLTELATSICHEIRHEGGLRVLVEKSSARSAVARLKGLKNQ